MAGATVNFLVDRPTRVERLLLFVAAPTLIVPEVYTDLAGLLVFLGVLAPQLQRVRAARARLTASAHSGRARRPASQ